MASPARHSSEVPLNHHFKNDPSLFLVTEAHPRRATVTQRAGSAPQ